MTLRVELISNMVAVSALREDWQALSASVPENTDFYASWDYTQAFLARHRPPEWVVVAVRETANGRLAAVFPFTVYQLTHDGAHYRVCQPLGMGYLTSIDYPVRSQVRRDVLQVLLNTVLKQHLKIDVAIFWPLHERSLFYLALLEDLGTSKVFKSMRFANNLHEIDTRGLDFARYRRACPGASFDDADYARRRLQRMGELRFTLAEPVETCRELLVWLCALNQAKFGDQHAFRHIPDWAGMLDHLTQTLVPRGIAQVSTLRLDGVPIVAGLSFLHKQRRYFNLIDYEPQLKARSPSKVFIAELIGATFDRGGVFCFGSGAMPYKADWAQSVGEIKSVLLFFTPEARAQLEPHLTQKLLGRLGNQ